MDQLQKEATDADKDPMQLKELQKEGAATTSAPVDAGPVQLMAASFAEPVQLAGGGAGAWAADAGLMSAFGLGAPVQAKLEGAGGEGGAIAASFGGTSSPGKSTSGGAVQLRAGGAGLEGADPHETAAAGVADGGGDLPFLDQIQASFGEHDVSGVRAHTGGAAAKATAALGAEAYATGNDVAFAAGSPSLHTAAHEAAHVVQQRAGVSLKGGMGEAGDSYEQHADAVADRVVQGKSASDLLSQMAPSPGGGGGGVQRKVVQFEIKADLRKAMEGLGTDEAAIFSRLQRATLTEIRAVLADATVMAELRSELDRGDMERVLELLKAPLAAKLRLAMDGWFNDNAYIQRALNAATSTELVAAGADRALVEQLVTRLGAPFLKTVLDRIQVPLARKIEFALEGWGQDEAYIYRAILLAPVPEIVALSRNTALLTKMTSEGWTQIHATLARRLYPGANADAAFQVLHDADEAILVARLTEYGNLEQQRALLDAVILAGANAVRVQQAFHLYWGVEVNSAPAVAATATGGDNGGPSAAVPARDWPIATIQSIHRQMKVLPSQDARSGIWASLSLTNEGTLINRAAWGDGDYVVGSNADTTSEMATGYSVALTSSAKRGDKKISVDEGGRFQVGDRLILDRGAPEAEPITIASITGNKYTLTTKLTKRHARGTVLDPDDGSGARTVNWLDATTRHEIAHSLDGGGVDTSGFYALGDWTLSNGDAGGFDDWVGAMGGTAWNRSDGRTINATDRAEIKAAIVSHVQGQSGSLYAAFAGNKRHAITKNRSKRVPVIEAAEYSLTRGDGFYQEPQTVPSVGGKRFTISWWYKRFQRHNEAVVSQRVADYGLYSPTEFFAEAYTVFYEEAGRDGITDDMHGRLIRNGTWRSWIRNNVHNRGLAPAGTGAASPGPAEGDGGGPVATAQTASPDAGARPGGSTRGRSSGNPGM